ARWRNVIGRNGVSENSEGARAGNVFDLPDRHREIFEERRFMNVIALFVPLINVAGAGWNFVPFRILIGEIAIKFAENFRRKRGLHGIAHFLQARPEIAQESFFSVLVFADRLSRQIKINPASITLGLLVLVQLVMAAIKTLPCPILLSP